MFQFSYKKCLKAVILAGSILLFGVSCKKEAREEIFPASVTIVNGISDTTSFVTTYFGNTQPKVYGLLRLISNGDSYDYATEKMNQPLTLFRNHDTSQPSKPFFKTNLQLEAGGIFTYFVYGTPSSVKQKMVREQLPQRSINDSAAYLRVINLFDNRPIDVVQLEPVVVTIASNLAYEQLSDFKRIPDDASIKNLLFEARDHATGAKLGRVAMSNFIFGSISMNQSWLFRPRTMLVVGTWTSEEKFSSRATSIGHY